MTKGDAKEGMGGGSGGEGGYRIRRGEGERERGGDVMPVVQLTRPHHKQLAVGET